MKRNFIVGLGLTLAAGAAFAADSGVLPSAAPSAAPSARIGATVDASADTATGAAASVGADFGKLDANADGKLTRAELKGNSEMTARFKALDKNKDGKLSSDEYAARNADTGGSGLDKPIN
ncbi:hypothetical protein D0B54_03070 [Solimonas sp. K1W22B-7]|uniref:hypothetical protein n=1 Tax=Solimonas sp. K1W22B-7 TaxID=2303331 RepID=UPI000E334336|nr:hypothetical protein [Solimonas sp. K1W22B-7]AXQ27710.1 hypothetical protein D0B54_03070 [Solimonas sp. K1W22B-7]